MQSPIKFNLPGEWNFERLMGGLGEPYTIRKDPDKNDIIWIYDTFDWRLFRKSLVLYHCDGKLCLRILSKREILHSVTIASPPVFVWEIPDSKLKQQLTPILGVRALLRLAEVRSHFKPFGLLDKEGKTVVRLASEEIRSTRDEDVPAPAANLWLLPVKGYPGHFRRLVQGCEEAGLTISSEDAVYLTGLKAAGKEPGSYSSKVTIQLRPDMRADEATKTILRFLLHVIRVNEVNIEKDLDTEFIHDLRVAVRRTRSALGQIRSVFPPKTTDRFRSDFAFVGRLTNALRDLDVYLLKENAYKARLAPVLRRNIEPLFDYLRKKRSEAFQTVVRGLKSQRYAKSMRAWEAYLKKPPPQSPTASSAKLPVIILARKRIFRKYRSVVKAGNRILAGTDDKMLHVLRIHCKKLRYLMEFFASLFPARKMVILVEHLKRLQDNLGDINDLRVQEEYLLSIASELPVNLGDSQKTFLAIGSLVGMLAADRQIAKDAFTKTFTDFSSPANKELFQNLFAPQTPGIRP